MIHAHAGIDFHNDLNKKRPDILSIWLFHRELSVCFQHKWSDKYSFWWLTAVRKQIFELASGYKIETFAKNRILNLNKFYLFLRFYWGIKLFILRQKFYTNLIYFYYLPHILVYTTTLAFIFFSTNIYVQPSSRTAWVTCAQVRGKIRFGRVKLFWLSAKKVKPRYFQ